MSAAECIDKLQGFRSLGDDWDGLGAVAFKPYLIETAVAVLNDTPRPSPRVSPMPCGGVLIEWHGPLEGEYLEAEITEPEMVEWMSEIPGYETRCWQARAFLRKTSCAGAGD